MAETITYDPSNDPQAIAEAEARDGENLAVGEDMQREQSELLAGKYKDAEELERAYIELQKKMGEGESPESQSTDEPQSVSDTYNEDGSVNYSTAKERYGDELGDIFEDAGIPRHAVESYLSGLYNSTWGGQPETLSERDVAEMMDMAGGKSNYNAMTEWAAANLDQEDIKAFDEVTNTGNKAAVRFAVKALMGQYEDAQGRTPELVTGKNARQGETYRSMAEVVRDMESPRYEKDEAYRFDVMRKLERSNLKV
jgi:hypothetical protein